MPTLNTAVLFVVFNRPDTTKLVFEAIRKARPTRLYIAADGPRPNSQSDIENQAAVKEIVSNVDWDCKVNTLYREENLGCGMGPASAYDWFFANEEEGIILEDDCMPDQSFFFYCQELLEKYRHDSKIMHITGSNFQKGWKNDTDYSYYFSSYPHEWGWATWRRAWKLYDFQVKEYPELIKKNYFDGYFDSKIEQKYRLGKIKNSYNNPNANWWDYQWSFALFSHSGLSIVPSVNLIENIGFGAGATHTLSSNDEFKQNKAQALELPLKHPPFIVRDTKSDSRYFKKLLLSILKRKAFGLLGIKGYDFRG